MFAVGRAQGAAALVAVLAIACATSPTGRRQLIVFPDAEMSAMGVAAYDKLKAEYEKMKPKS